MGDAMRNNRGPLVSPPPTTGGTKPDTDATAED